MVKNTFASDAYNGIHPTILESIIKMNELADGYSMGQETQEIFKKNFGNTNDVFFVCTGTAANVLSLSTMVKPYQGIICAESSHLNVDECGAPERFIGSKLLLVPSKDGKLNVKDIQALYMNDTYKDDAYKVQPKVISITQPTELGYVYTPQEIQEITSFAHAHNMLVHMDGARLCIAAAFLQVSLAAITKDVGVDVVCFGGTKQGMMMGEAVIFFNKELGEDFPAVQVQGMQRASKMHFISAQFSALLANNFWFINSCHAIQMAQLLAHELAQIPGITISKPVESNAVFAYIDPQVISLLQKKYFFYLWDESKSEARFMTSWNTQLEDIKEFIIFIKDTIKIWNNK